MKYALVLPVLPVLAQLAPTATAVELEEESKDGWWRLGARLDLNHIL